MPVWLSIPHGHSPARAAGSDHGVACLPFEQEPYSGRLDPRLRAPQPRRRQRRATERQTPGRSCSVSSSRAEARCQAKTDTGDANLPGSRGGDTSGGKCPSPWLGWNRPAGTPFRHRTRLAEPRLGLVPKRVTLGRGAVDGRSRRRLVSCCGRTRSSCPRPRTRRTISPAPAAWPALPGTGPWRNGTASTKPASRRKRVSGLMEGFSSLHRCTHCTHCTALQVGRAGCNGATMQREVPAAAPLLLLYVRPLPQARPGPVISIGGRSRAGRLTKAVRGAPWPPGGPADRILP
jgi:hypothetical protein